jgi:hypothetical protein
MEVPSRVTLLENELSDHENEVAHEIVSLRNEMKASARATNQLLFGILVVLLTVLGGFITQLVASR